MTSSAPSPPSTDSSQQQQQQQQQHQHPSQQQQQPHRQPVKFLPFRSIAEPSFWLDHNAAKLNELRLSEEGVPLRGFFGVATVGGGGGSSSGGSSVGGAVPAGMRFDASSNDNAKASAADASAAANVDDDSDDASSSGGAAAAAAVRRNEWIRSRGEIYSLNTLESLKKMNKNAFLNEKSLPPLLKCCGIGNDVENNGDEDDDDIKEEEDPNSALVSAICIAFCNLKTNVTVYWFAFPALAPRSGCGIAYSSNNNAQRRLADAWGTGACRALSNAFYKFRISHEKKEMSRTGTRNGEVWCPPFFLLLAKEEDSGDGTRKKRMRCLPLDKTTYDSLNQEEKDRVIFGFVDPNKTPAASASSGGDTTTFDAVGWTLRNLVAYLSLTLGLGGSDRTFVSYRSPFLRRITPSEVEAATTDEEMNAAMSGISMHESYEDLGDDSTNNDDDAGIGGSLLLNIAIPLASEYQWPDNTKNNNDNNDNDNQPPPKQTQTQTSIYSNYRCVGWELNKNRKPGPRSVDLRPLVSPAHLARQANDLNLRLMKWRALPSLDVDRLARMRVLLLGAGTLGCGVARTLLGWGVRHITFVDSGRVSYSNPVRQSLFCVGDCKDGGKHKAVAAAESLITVAGPDVKSEGVVLTIPMPGHSFGRGKNGAAETEAVRKDVAKLHSLIEGHDVVFLLTDTRESRWLPTVMALATDTPLINAALGLDSWLVMRHGPPSSSLEKCTASNNDISSNNNRRLGCYFCSDVVAPENSTRDRTLDQQCTVTRPGLAPIAASMATELMVAMEHHPLRHCAPAPVQQAGNAGQYTPVDDGRDASSSTLGRMPHQIRGTVVTYTMMTPTVPAFPSCTACADGVVAEYRKEGFEFVKKVCCDGDGSYLERVSGLEAFREEAARKMEECLDWDDDDDDDEE